MTTSASAMPAQHLDHLHFLSLPNEIASRTAMSLLFTSVQDSGSAALVSEQKAFNYSLYGTLIPAPTLIFTIPGLIVGPSLGYFHAELNTRALTGIGLRTLATGGIVSAFVICGWDCGPGAPEYDEAWAVFIGSSGLLAGSAIYDIATVKRAVRRSKETRSNASWTIEPVYYSHSKSVGVNLRLTF